MPLTLEDVQPLLVLQQIDLEIRQKQKQLDGLPQRGEIASVRQKRSQVESKGAQVAALLEDVERELGLQRFEDEQLAGKQAEAQAKIEETQGDYRAVAAYSKELEGFEKRRETLRESVGVLKSRKSEIVKVEAQVKAALDALERQESSLIASFQEEGGVLTEAISRAKAARSELAGRIDADLTARYEKAVKKCGGVGIARLADQRCSACRNRVDDNRMPQLRREAPLAVCPSCGRLLVVE